MPPYKIIAFFTLHQMPLFVDNKQTHLQNGLQIILYEEVIIWQNADRTVTVWLESSRANGKAES